MPAPWTYDQGQQLVKNGYLSPELFSQAYPEQPQPPAAMDPLAEVMPPLPPLGQSVSDPIPMPPAPPPTPPAPVSQAEMMENAYAQAYPPSPDVTTTDGLGQRDAMMTNAYASAYGEPVQTTEVQAPDVVAQQAGNVAQNAQYNPDGIGLIEPAIPGQVQGQTMPAPDYLAQMGQQVSPYNSEIDAIRQYEKTAEAQAAEESAFLRQQEKNYQDQVKRSMEADQVRQKQIDEQYAKLQQAETDLAEKKVDPDRFWANKSTGQKIMAGVALILGGFGAGRTGENMAVKVINDAVARDIDQQRFDIKNSQDSVTQKRGVLGDMMGLFKDERMARDAAMAQGLQVASMRLQSIAARSKGNEVKLKAATAIAGIEQKRQEHLAKFQSSLARYVVMTSLAKGMPVNTAMLPVEDQEKMVGIPGKKFYGFARSKEGAQKIRDKVSDIEGGRDALGTLMQIADMARTGKISPELNAKAETIRGALMGKMRLALLGPGAITPGEWERLEKIIADPTKIMSLGNEGKKLRELKNMVDYGWEQELNANGLELPENMALNALGGRRK